jgi:hypothetical protein
MPTEPCISAVAERTLKPAFPISFSWRALSWRQLRLDGGQAGIPDRLSFLAEVDALF